jgi:predicted DNA-binding transcriptional regulator AlpA
MNLIELIKDNPNVNLTVSAKDLRNFALELIDISGKAEKSNPDKLLTPAEACRILRISAPTMWRKERAGFFKPTMIGGRKFYKQAELNRIMGGVDNG